MTRKLRNGWGPKWEGYRSEPSLGCPVFLDLMAD